MSIFISLIQPNIKCLGLFTRVNKQKSTSRKISWRRIHRVFTNFSYSVVFDSENCVVRNIMLIEKIIKRYFWTQRTVLKQIEVSASGQFLLQPVYFPSVRLCKNIALIVNIFFNKGRERVYQNFYIKGRSQFLLKCVVYFLFLCKVSLISQRSLSVKYKKHRFTVTIATRWTFIRCDTRCPGGVSVSESARNGQCGLTLLRKCHSHNTKQWVLAAERVENSFWQTND